jgi:group I intron endonuclease
MATAFLGYLCSPKCYKCKRNHNLNFNKLNINKLNIQKLNLNARRYYSAHSSTEIDESFNKKSPSKLQKFIWDKNLKPVYVYENPHLESVKKSIKDNVKGLSGIYLILNKVTLDYYIGSGSTDRLYSRFYKHLISLQGSKILKLAVRKYKLENFVYILIEIFPEKVTKENNKKLLDLEDFYLKSLIPNYNILTEAGSSFGYKHTELDRIRMKAIYSDERRNAIGSLNKGKSLSEETRSKLKEKALLRSPLPIGRVFDEKALLNMKKRSKQVILFNKDGTTYGDYSSIKHAAEMVDCCEKTIRRALLSKSKILMRRWFIKIK